MSMFKEKKLLIPEAVFFHLKNRVRRIFNVPGKLLPYYAFFLTEIKIVLFVRYEINVQPFDI
jgi:hypothetical protein